MPVIEPDLTRIMEIAERQPDRWFDCERCGYRHHPYMPCVAGENTVCKNCGERGHFECFYD